MERDKRGLDTRDITFAAVGVALMTASAWVTLPIGPVPFTLQTMALAFVLVGMGRTPALLAVLVYLALGGVGLPLFSGMRGGVAVLFGPTGGFLVGFAVAAALAWFVRGHVRESVATDVGIVIAMIVCSYGIGWAWLMVSAHMGALAAFGVAIAPFVVPDAVKCACGIALARAVRRAAPGIVRA